MITFRFESNANLTFAHVPDNGFFVSADGRLCQKIDACYFNTIADSGGIPYATHDEGWQDMPIEKILPPITRIEF